MACEYNITRGGGDRVLGQGRCVQIKFALSCGALVAFQWSGGCRGGRLYLETYLKETNVCVKPNTRTKKKGAES